MQTIVCVWNGICKDISIRTRLTTIQLESLGCNSKGYYCGAACNKAEEEMKRVKGKRNAASQRVSQVGNYETLERRIVLAADVMTALNNPADWAEPAAETCMAAEVRDLNAQPKFECFIPSDLPDTNVSIANEGSRVDPGESMTFDLTDRTDGAMIALNGGSSSTISMTASMDGRLEINCATDPSTGSKIDMEIRNANSVVASSAASPNGGGTFKTFSIDVCEGEQLELVLKNSCNATVEVQATATISELPIAAPPATASDNLNFLLNADDEMTFLRNLEVESNVDQFQFTASADGRTALDLTDMSSQDALELQLTVTDQNGDVLAKGSTNEMVKLSFDTTKNQYYTVTVSEAEGKPAEYKIAVTTRAVPTDTASTDDSTVVTAPCSAGETWEQPLPEKVLSATEVGCSETTVIHPDAEPVLDEAQFPTGSETDTVSTDRSIETDVADRSMTSNSTPQALPATCGSSSETTPNALALSDSVQTVMNVDNMSIENFWMLNRTSNSTLNSDSATALDVEATPATATQTTSTPEAIASRTGVNHKSRMGERPHLRHANDIANTNHGLDAQGTLAVDQYFEALGKLSYLQTA